jgi:diketogulonate reductase-like aldo/keto reductase
MPTRAMRADGLARTLADGNEIPLLGLGVWQVPNGRECVAAVRWALEAGYRHSTPLRRTATKKASARACVKAVSRARRVRHDHVLFPAA